MIIRDSSKMKHQFIRVIILSLCGCFLLLKIDTNAADRNTVIGKEYAHILNKYYVAYEDARIGDDDFDMKFVNNNFYIDSQPTVYEGQPDFCYRVMDYNDDGTPELFILLRYDRDKGEIYDAFTYLNGKPKRIVAENIGYRAGTCSFCKNGIVESLYIGGYDYTRIKYQKYSSKKGAFSTFLVISDIHGTCLKKENGRTKEITRKQYNRIQKGLGKKRKIRFYLYSDTAGDNITNGIFLVEGQKAWDLLT